MEYSKYFVFACLTLSNLLLMYSLYKSKNAAKETRKDLMTYKKNNIINEFEIANYKEAVILEKIKGYTKSAPSMYNVIKHYNNEFTISDLKKGVRDAQRQRIRRTLKFFVSLGIVKFIKTSHSQEDKYLFIKK